MQLSEVRKKAKALGLNPGNMQKIELIRAIQTKEGNFPCFATATDYCDQSGCCFKEDCLGKYYN